VTATHPGVGRTRTRVLAALQAAGSPMTVTTIAEELGVHPNSVRFHLDHLIAADLVIAAKGTGSGQGRPPTTYRVSPDAPPMSSQHLLELASVLLAHFVPDGPDTRGRAVAAGRDWAAGLADPDRPGHSTPEGIVDQLIEHLSERGFATERTATGLAFTRCPFWNTIPPEHLPVVCAIHQGLVDGFLAQAGTQIRAGDIRSDTRPCLVDLEDAVTGPGR